MGFLRPWKKSLIFMMQGVDMGKKMNVNNQTLSGDSLKLTEKEKKELLAFIYSLNENIIFEEPPVALPSSSDKDAE